MAPSSVSQFVAGPSLPNIKPVESMTLISRRNVPITELRVLIVDDEDMIPTLLMAVFTKMMGLKEKNIRIARNGKEGWELFQSQPFDLVITDRNMPFLKGEELARRIKKAQPRIPVLMITGREAGDPEILPLLKEGILDEAFGKPFDLSRFRRTIEGLHKKYFGNSVPFVENSVTVEKAL